MNHLELFADPLGDVYIEWQLDGSKQISINLPHYKYEMSNFIGIPVPFASIAEKIECEVVKVCSRDDPDQLIEYVVRNEFNGVNNLIIEQDTELALRIQYVIRNLVNRDKVFFSFVFSLASPTNNFLETSVAVTARFSYDINSHRLQTALIGRTTGRIEGWPGLLSHSREGDYIRGVGAHIKLGEDQYDLHVHGSRLPFMIDRRIFWLVIFAIAIIGVGTLLSVLKIK